MKLKRFTSWLQGLFEKESTEARIADEAALKLNNIDVDIAGRLVRRLGYDHWSDLESDNSIWASNYQPLVNSATRDFYAKVQGMYYFTDVAGVDYLFVVVNKKVYAEVNDGGNKTWLLLNPTSVIDLVETAKYIKIVSYYDTVFINDIENNVYMFNSQQYGEGGWVITGNRFMYFAGDTVYVRSHVDFSDTSEDIVIEDSAATNLSGTAIYDSLASVTGIDFIGTEPGIVLPANLNFGYCVRVGNSTVGYSYFVLSNGLNEVAQDKCYIVKFNDKLIAQEYAVLTMTSTGEVISFDTYDDDIYIWCQNGRIEIFDSNLAATVIGNGDSSDVDDFVAPVNDAGKSQYSLAVDSTGIYVYTEELPSKSDWMQYFEFSESYPARVLLNKNIQSVETTVSVTKGSTMPMIYADGHLWVGNYDGSVDKIDPATNTISATITAGSGYPSAIMYAGGYIWVTQGINTSSIQDLVKIDPATNLVDGTVVSIGTNFGKLAYSGGYVWYQAIESFFIRVDPTTLATVHYGNLLTWDGTSIVDRVTSITYVDSYLWAGTLQGFLYKFDPSTFTPGSTTKTPLLVITLLPSVNTLLYDGGYLWARTNSDVFKIEPGAPTVDATIPTGNAVDVFNCYGMSYGDSHLWVANAVDSSVLKIEPVNDEVVATISITGSTHSTAYGDSSAWASQPIATAPAVSRLSKEYYLDGSDFNSTYFTSATLSLSLLLVGVDFSGDIIEETINYIDWRCVFVLQLLADLKDIVPIQINDGYLYAGMVTNNTIDDGEYLRINSDFNVVENEGTITCNNKVFVQGDSESRMIMCGTGTGYYRSGSNWLWSNAINPYNDYTDLSTYNSNLSFYVLQQVQDVTNTDSDKLRTLGSPKQPIVLMDNDDLSTPSDLELSTVFRYYVTFKFLDNKTTDLSPASEEITVPTLGADPQDVKIVISELNLLSASGVQLYTTASIKEIEVYRAQKDSGETIFSDPIFLAKMEKDDDDLWFYTPSSKVYAEGVFEDNQQSITPYNPFTRNNVTKYPCKDIVVHKNRLVLVNKTSEINSNVLHYSDIDSAEALPPTNLRDVESGDGDSLVAGISVKDFLFLFKEFRIYGILGDVATGQLVDVSFNIGTQFPRTVCVYNDIVYFMNRAGIFQGNGPQVVKIRNGALDDIFDESQDDCIDLSNSINNAFAYVNRTKQEIEFHVPRKSGGVSQATNNSVIVYDIAHQLFTTRSYNSGIFYKIEAKDLISRDNIELMSTTDDPSLILKMNTSLNDNGSAITYTIWTKAFAVDNDVLRKSYKFLKLFGDNLTDITLTLTIDGVDDVATITNRDVGSHEETIATIHAGAFANRIIVKITGGAVSQERVSIDEMLLGMEYLRGSMR